MIWASAWPNLQNGMCAKWRLRSAWASAQWSVFAVCMKKAWVLSYPLSPQQRLWSDWVDAQADLSLSWVHMPFCHALAHILCADYVYCKGLHCAYDRKNYMTFSMDILHQPLANICNNILGQYRMRYENICTRLQFWIEISKWFQLEGLPESLTIPCYITSVYWNHWMIKWWSYKWGKSSIPFLFQSEDTMTNDQMKIIQW